MLHGPAVSLALAVLVVLATSIFTLAANAQTSGLVAAYAFNESAGSTVTDSSGSNNTGTLNSGATRTTAGKYGSALVFNGTSGVVTISHAASLNLTTGMTLEAWVYPTVTPTGWRSVVTKNVDRYYLMASSDQGNRPAVGGTWSGGNRNLAGPSVLPVNTWTHLAATYDGVAVRLYVNGVQVASRAETTPLTTSTGTLQIGGNAYAGENFAGRLDEVRIYNRALTAAEIQTDMATPVGGTPPPDTSPPSVVITTPTTGATYPTNATPLTMGGTAADNVGVNQVTWANDLGGSGTATGTTSWSAAGIPLQPGTNVITVTARDAAQNPGTAALTVSYDPTPPTVAITTPTTEPTYTPTTSPMALGGTAGDNLGVTQVTWGNDRGGSGTAAGTGTWAVTGGITLQPGTNVITATARDAAGNTAAATLTVSYTVPDTTPPSVAITTPTGGPTYATNATPLTVGGTAADNVGVSQVTWANDRGGSGPATGTTSWSAGGIGLQAGANIITVTARDAANNPGTTTLTVTYDPTAPTVSLTAPGANATVAGTVNVTATAADNIAVAGVQFLLDGAALGAEQTTSPYAYSWSTSGVSNGAHTLSARARDAAGNTTLATNVPVTVSNAQPAGLVAAYAFSESVGNTVTDSSGSNNTGTLNSGATRTTAGKYGSALVFNGTSGVVTISHAASLNLTTRMTLEAWVYPTVTPTGWRSVVTKNVDRYYLMASSDQGNRPSVGGTWSGGNQNTAGPSVLPVSTWTHLAATYDGVAVRLYVNGVQVASQAQTGTLTTSTGTLQIGGNAYAGENFAGRLDEVRIYNRALTAAEIQTDMATPVGGTPPPDTSPPTVAITAPAQGSTVSNLVTVVADATDDVAVSGVQFFVDGQPLGAEVLEAPYSIVWDTTSSGEGGHTLTAVARDPSSNSTTSTPITVTVVTASGAQGQWAAPVNWPIVAVHAHLLSTGEVLASDGQDAGAVARIWNPSTGVFTTVDNPFTNIFCGGHCQMADGRILIAGGHVTVHWGVADTNIFDPTTRQWTRVASMHTERWYPTNTTLPDGRILVTAGEVGCADCDAPIPEVYDPQTNVWTELTAAYLPLPYYPHMFVLPDGRVLASSTSEHPIVSQVLDVAARTWTVVDPVAVDGGSAAMYLPGKILKAGTSYHADDPWVPSAATSYVIDMTQPAPVWRQTPSMAFARTYHTLTVLPDATVLVTGGGTTTNPLGVNQAVLQAELWSPTTETWTVVASMSKPRLYHSTALLLPDARVLVLGGGKFDGGVAPTDQFSSELYSPPYLFKGPRPVITSAPATTTYGAAIDVQTPDAASIASVSFVRLGSVTHTFNMDQRLVPLAFTAGAGNLSVQAPANANLAPPGYYMLFIIDTTGVPSVAAIIRIF